MVTENSKTETITLQRHGSVNWLEKTLDNGVYISIKQYQFEEVLVEIYKKDEINIREVFKTDTGARLYLEEKLHIKISDEVEAYIVNKGNNNLEDVYHAAAVWCEYSQTFRTPIENYLIAVLMPDGYLDFTQCDGQLKDKVELIPNRKQLQNHAKWMRGRKDKDNVWTAWLLSEYMKESGEFRTVKTTVEKMNKCSVNLL